MQIVIYRLKINKDRKYVLENENEELNNKYHDVLRKLRESESRYID
jgi:stress response protein YsnF